MRQYHRNVLIAWDQLLNTLLGGWPDETLSSRAYRLALVGSPWPMRAIDTMARCFGDKDHCWESYESERKRVQAPPEARNT